MIATVEGVLGRAKELLQSEGWWQPGDGNPASGRRCAHEAILDACNGVSRLNGKPAVSSCRASSPRMAVAPASSSSSGMIGEGGRARKS